MRTVKALLASGLAAMAFCTAAWADVNWGDTNGTGSDSTAAASSDTTMAETASAAAPAVDSYGLSADDIAVNQGIVAYWYTHGYANCSGGFPAKFADLKTMGLPLRKWVSPHTGEAIDADDGKLDFDGDFTYSCGGGDVSITVKTSSGQVSVPGTFSGTDGCSTRCCDIYICGFDCWNCCGEDGVCRVIQWMLWESFETYECLYGGRPCDEMAWIASGLAPIDKNWKELAPFMEIEYIWGNCCLKKAKVECCPCSPCKDRCGSCNKCGVKSACGKSNCGGCNKCGVKSTCGKSNCGGCNKCKPVCKSNCGGCNKCGVKSACGKSNCGGCNKCGVKAACGKSNCGGCNKCKPVCKSDCGGCNKCGVKASCGGCGKSNCSPCNKCNRCAKSTCNSCNKASGKCGSRMWEA